MYLRFFRFAGLAGAIALLVSLPNESLAQAAKVSVEELTKVSTSVVHGHTTKIESYWTKDKRYIMTDITIRVEGVLKGSTPSETVVTIPGGRVGSTLYEVSDMPIFVEGEEIVVFFWDHPSGTTTVTGGVNGKLPIYRDIATGRKVVLGSSELFKSEAAGKVDQNAPRANLSLEEFKARIREIDAR